MNDNNDKLIQKQIIDGLNNNKEQYNEISYIDKNK